MKIFSGGESVIEIFDSKTEYIFRQTFLNLRP